MLARIPIDPKLMALADAGRVEEIDSPLPSELARALLDRIAATPKQKQTISLI
ncbi:MAG: hypothetical protein JOY59_04420 [Candidatus Eremiobacteraeota bacterium]|nr:hypothetical protein [Candidatus Eremiobacteraeota bacterium]